MKPNPIHTLEDILKVLPHRAPFLFVDRVMKLDPGRQVIAERDLRPEEPHFAGHFPGQAIMPGVLVTEALAQTSGLLLAFSEMATAGQALAEGKLFFLATAQMKYSHPSRPGDTLVLRAESEKAFAGMHRFRVEATVGRHLIGSGTLTLAQIESKS